MPDRTLYLIDGSGFIFRAYHALPPLTRADGTPVGAVMGFCNMLLRVLDEAEGARVAVVFDSKRQNFRHKLFPDYKANRTEPPEDLQPQFAIVREATQAFCVPGLELEGFEADDLIAAYTRIGLENGLNVKIISSDKDLMQLVRDGVRLLDPIKFTLIGPEQVIEKFGVTPDKVVDVQALAGDSTDNVPGVPGIGVKTAAELINQYGDLEALLQNTAQIKQPKRRETLEHNRDMALLSKKLVALDAYAPLPVPIDDLTIHAPDIDRLTPFLIVNGFRSLLARVEKKWGKAGDVLRSPVVEKPPSPEEKAHTQQPTRQPVSRDYRLITDMADLEAVIVGAREKTIIAIDTETNHLTPAQANLVGISIAWDEGQACYIPVGHTGDSDDLFADKADVITQLDKAAVIQKLKPLLEDPAVLKVGQNLKYDLQMFLAEGVRIAPYDDTIIMSYDLDGSKHGHGLDELSALYLSEQLIAYGDVAGKGKAKKTLDQLHPDAVKDYASEDADMTLRLCHVLKPRLLAEKQMALYHNIDKPLVDIIARMEYAGIKVDCDILKKLSDDFSHRIVAAEKAVFDHVGQEFNLGSPKQMGDILFGVLGLPGGKKTKTGAYSTDAKTLEDLALQGHAIVDDILQWRQLSKLKSTYTEALQHQINPRTGRVHTSFGLTVTNTGRLSSTDPNLQNIPIRTEEGRLIRTAFVAEPGKKLISVDYSQIELRLIAEMANIKRLKQAFMDGIDIHALTASEVFDIPLEQMTSERRRAAKAINFGIIYGISGFGLGKQLGVDPGTANAYIKQYMARFPELAVYMETTKKFAKQHGYVETVLGRRCYMPGITSKNGAERAFAERQAINAPIQGTAADIMKLGMINVDRIIADKKLPATLLLQVHDELVLECDENAVHDVMSAVKQAMERAVTLGVPLLAEAGFGDNWGAAH